MVALQGAAVSAPNLIKNGGFEQRVPGHELSAQTASRDVVRCVKRVPEDRLAWGWVPEAHGQKRVELTGEVVLDGTVCRSGQCSVRIRNAKRRDITLVRYDPSAFLGGAQCTIKPNTKYTLRWWVKGRDVTIGPDGKGPVMMGFRLTSRGDEGKRAYFYEDRPVPTGTFDWQQRTCSFVSEEDAHTLHIGLQLRWATGTVWYDDVELIEVGPVVRVETY